MTRERKYPQLAKLSRWLMIIGYFEKKDGMAEQTGEQAPIYSGFGLYENCVSRALVQRVFHQRRVNLAGAEGTEVESLVVA
jgi:hypothetical protein